MLEGELYQCETFLRAISSLSGEELADEFWQQCQRHEWHGLEWDSSQEKIVRRDAEKTILENSA